MSVAAVAGMPWSCAARRPLSFRTTAQRRDAAALSSSAAAKLRRKVAAVTPAPSASVTSASRADTTADRSVHRDERRPFLRRRSLGHCWILIDQLEMSSSSTSRPSLKVASKTSLPPRTIRVSSSRRPLSRTWAKSSAVCAEDVGASSTVKPDDGLMAL